MKTNLIIAILIILFKVIDNKMHPPVGRQKSASPKPQVGVPVLFQMVTGEIMTF